MKKKFLACDIDGTLNKHEFEQEILPSDLKAIEQFRNAGNYFSLCTGRTLIWTIPLLKTYKLYTDALILCNGSTIYTVSPDNYLEFNELVNNRIPNNIGLEIIEYFYNLKEYTIYWDNGKDTFEIKDRLLKTVSSIIQENFSKHINIKNALLLKDEFATIGITPMSGDVEETKKIQKTILEKWGKYISAYRNQIYMDIAPLNSSKGTGVRFLNNYLDEDFEIYSVGDSYNDLSMFEEVGKENAFIMDSADDSLKSAGNYIVESVAECIDIILSR